MTAKEKERKSGETRTHVTIPRITWQPPSKSRTAHERTHRNKAKSMPPTYVALVAFIYRSGTQKKDPHGLGIAARNWPRPFPIRPAADPSRSSQAWIRDRSSAAGCNNAGAQLKASAPAARLTPAGPARSHETARCEAVPSALSSAVANRHTGRPAHGWSRVLIVNSDRQDIHPTRRTSPAAARAVQLNRRPPRPLLLRYPLTGPARGPQRADAADAIHIAFAKAVPNGRPPGDGRGRRSTRWDRASLGPWDDRKALCLSPGP